MIKFLIVGENSINKVPLIDLLLQNKGKFKIASIFTTNQEDANKKYYYYIDNMTLNMCHKNNAIVYVKTVVSDSYGVTIDEFEDSNVIFMNTEDFNNISNKVFLTSDELVIIWLDTKNHDDRVKNEMRESEYLIEKINQDKLKYLYFLDTPIIEIMDVICEYLENESSRKELLEKYE